MNIRNFISILISISIAVTFPAAAEVERIYVPKDENGKILFGPRPKPQMKAEEAENQAQVFPLGADGTVFSTLDKPEEKREIEKIEAVEVNDGRTDVLPVGAKITFKRAEQSLREVWQNSKDEVVVRYAKTALADLEKFSPENMWNQRFVENIQLNAQYKAIKEANSPKTVSIRFPLEIVMFNGVIAANACMHSAAHYLTTGARTNITCLDTFTNSFKDPISSASFAAFVAFSAATQYTGAKMIGLLDKKTLGIRADALMKQFDNVAKKKVAGSAIARMENKALHLVNPAISGTTKFAPRLLGPVGMAIGMLGSRILEESIRDENIQMCSKGVYLNSTNQNAPPQWWRHCQSAFDAWFKGKRAYQYSVDMAGLVSASLLSHGIFNAIGFGLKFSGGAVAQTILKGLQFQFQFGKNGLKSMAPQFKILNTILSPLAPASIANLSMFLTVDHSFVARFTGKIKIDHQEEWLAKTKRELDGKLYTLVSESRLQKHPKDNNVDRLLFDYEGELAAYRQMKLGMVSESVNNWMNASNKFLAIYQATYQFYRDFFYSDAQSLAPSTLNVNPFDHRDYIRKVYSWIDRGMFAPNPMRATVNSVSQNLPGSSLNYETLLKGLDYNDNEIINFPLYSKLETLANGSTKLFETLISNIESGGRRVNEKEFLSNTLGILKAGSPSWADLLKLASEKLDIEQKEILKIAQNLRAGDYKLPAKLVLTDKEMSLLKFEGEDKDPRVRDVIDLINRGDKRSVKELDIRMKRVDEGLKALGVAVKKYPSSTLIKIAKEYIGESSTTPPAGTKYLSALLADKERFNPDLFSYFPTSLRYVHSLRPVDYLMISMACGPDSDLLKPANSNASFGELLNSPLITSPVGSALVFNPPGLTYIGDTMLRNEICDRQQSAETLYEKEFTFNGKKYSGLISLVRATLKNKFRKFSLRENGRENTDVLNFDIWWNTHVKPLAQGILEKFQSEYYHIVIEDVVPSLIKEGIFSNINDDVEYLSNVIQKLSYEKKARADLKVSDIKERIFNIENFLARAAVAKKIFPNGGEKTDISYLANSNATYLQMREELVAAIDKLAKDLGHDIGDGLKFAKENNSEAERTLDTSLRMLMTITTEIHRYSDMIYVLAKNISNSPGQEMFGQ